jgi:small GTP-binding protein
MNSIANGASSANRTHIGFFGRMNAGKSSLINALTKQPAAIVSDIAGTTTDVVKKPMEIHGIGACTLLDTAGFDDASELGRQRISASRRAAEETDLAVILFT